MDKSKEKPKQLSSYHTMLSLNPIFKLNFLQEDLHERKSVALPRIDHPSLRETVTQCFTSKNMKPQTERYYKYGKVSRRRGLQSKQLRLSSLMTREMCQQRRAKAIPSSSFEFKITKYANIR